MRRLEVWVPEDVHEHLVALREAGRGRSVSEIVRQLLQKAADEQALGELGQGRLSAGEMVRRSYAILLKLEYLYERAVAEQGETGERALAKARMAVRRALVAAGEAA